MANRARVLIQCAKCKKDLIEFWTDVPFRQVDKMYCRKCYETMSKKIEKIREVSKENRHYVESVEWISEDVKKVKRIKKRINAIIK